MLKPMLFLLVVGANMVIANRMADRERKIGRTGESTGGLFNRKW